MIFKTNNEEQNTTTTTTQMKVINHHHESFAKQNERRKRVEQRMKEIYGDNIQKELATSVKQYNDDNDDNKQEVLLPKTVIGSRTSALLFIKPEIMKNISINNAEIESWNIPNQISNYKSETKYLDNIIDKITIGDKNQRKENLEQLLGFKLPKIYDNHDQVDKKVEIINQMINQIL